MPHHYYYISYTQQPLRHVANENIFFVGAKQLIVSKFKTLLRFERREIQNCKNFNVYFNFLNVVSTWTPKKNALSNNMDWTVNAFIFMLFGWKEIQFEMGSKPRYLRRTFYMILMMMMMFLFNLCYCFLFIFAWHSHCLLKSACA